MKRLLSILLAVSLLSVGALAETPAPEQTTVAPAASVEQTAAETPPTTTTDAPATDAPTTDAPATDAPTTDAPPTDAPPTDVPPTDAPTTDAPTTDAPTSPAPDASESPAPEPEGYLLDAQGAKLQGGALKDLLQTEGALKVCVSTRKLIAIENFPLTRLKEIEFLPDEEAVGKNFRVVCSASDRLADEYTQELIDALPQDVTGTLYIWLREELPEPTQTPAPDRQLTVDAENYIEGAWSCLQPAFTLSGIGEGDSGCAYAAIILDERIAVLSDNVYRPAEEGVYGVRFAIMDDMGDLTCRSDKYNLWLDFTPPDLNIEVSAEKDRSMTLHMADALSGLDALSLDGGDSWIALDGMESYPYTAPEKQTFAPGMILLRDVAGNISANADEVVLDKIPKGFGGGGGGGGDGKPKKQHASGDGDDAQYNAYDLALPEGAVRSLTLGGEEVELSLEVVDENDASVPGAFGAKFIRWARANQPAATEGDAPADPDTLLLTAAELPAEKEAFDCVWKINGAVLRKLFNSDIRYLLLDANGTMLSLPTQGFTAGTRYAQLKMQGVSTAEFDYEIYMRFHPEEAADGEKVPFSRAQGCMPEIWTEVAGERFEMLDRASTPEMYPLDVYCAPDDLPDYPYGAYPAFADGAETEE